MCRDGRLVATRDGDMAGEAAPASPRGGPRPTHMARVERLLESAALELGLADAAVDEARRLLADRTLRVGRKNEISVTGALYWAAAAAGAPRTVEEALGWHPALRTRRAALVRMVRAIHRRRGVGRVPRAPDYVDTLAHRVGLGGAGARAAREYAERHRDSGRSPIVIAAAALVVEGGASVLDAARAAGITAAGVKQCIKALAAS
eukprot:tig00000540_g1927.t1